MTERERKTSAKKASYDAFATYLVKYISMHENRNVKLNITYSL